MNDNHRSGTREPMLPTRRNFLRTIGGVMLGALPPHAWPDDPVIAAPPQADWCGGERGTRLFVPTDRGFLGRIELDGDALTLRAVALKPDDGAPPGLTRAYLARFRGRDYVNPTLVLRRGRRARIELVNEIGEATIVHWHGLTVNTRNDGGGTVLAAPGERYAYDFEARNRASLYWYHPHPHGMTAGQAYRGMFGLLEIEDDDEAKLRAALDLLPGASEIPLVLHDRRPGDDYAPAEADRMHGFLGDGVRVNGTPCPYLDVATRLYRFRVLNASNARTYRLGWRSASGRPVPFTLIGNDGGLLPAPQVCAEAFLSSAERLDLLLDLRDSTTGETLLLETRAFDPMHMEMPGSALAVDHAAMGHGAGTGDVHATHAAHSGSFPEGAARALLQLRVREQIPYARRIPQQLSAPAPIDVSHATERPLRLGFAKGRWRINDRVFAMGETPIEVKRDTTETWLIRNYFNSMPHAMHLHGFSFEVLERQTSPEQVAALKIDERGRLATDLGRKDTVLVWPGESVRVALDFACPFPGPQTYMLHCHNLEHEDGGMMLGVKVG